MGESEPSPESRRGRNKSKLHKIFNWGIPFYEGILERNPNHIDVLTVLGDLYTKQGHIEKGLDADARLAGLRPRDPIVHYNLACSYALINDADSALSYLRRAVELGFRDVDHMRRDSDLKNVRQDPRFRELLDDTSHPQHSDS